MLAARWTRPSPANVTATVTAGVCTLGGTVTRACVAGVADFSDF
jgi:hypothetical protein